MRPMTGLLSLGYAALGGALAFTAPLDPHASDFRSATHQVHRSGSRASHLVLPVVTQESNDK
jgi:hypothetical protein